MPQYVGNVMRKPGRMAFAIKRDTSTAFALKDMVVPSPLHEIEMAESRFRE